jgi:hypothetical protein
MSDTNDVSKRTVTLLLDAVLIDPALQMREGMNEATIDEYAEAMKEGVAFPPVVVFRAPNGRLWLSDGFHRFKAARRAGRTHLEAEVRPGDRRDALLHAAGANAAHGLRRTRADKQKAVRAVLDDPELCEKSSREIAKICLVSEFLVRSIRAEDGGAINRTPGAAGANDPPAGQPKDITTNTTPPQANGQAHSSDSDPTTAPELPAPPIPPNLKPPPGAGDAWEPPRTLEEYRQYQEETRAANVPRDMVGNELPPRLRDVFAHTFYDDAQRWLGFIASHVQKDPRLFVRLHVYPMAANSFYSRLLAWEQEARQFLEYHRPHAVCIDCRGEGGTCTTCLTTGWLSQGEYNEMLNRTPLAPPMAV